MSRTELRVAAALARRATEAWGEVRPAVEAMTLRLWAEAELPLLETRSAGALADWLAGEGFDVERGAGGIQTAFVARSGQGPGPAVGLLAEYDALPGQGNRAEPARAPDGRRAGHACGHNQIGAAVAGAAVAARRALVAAGRPGRLVVLGCPAEEILWGKLALLEAGAFDGLDVLLACHADYQNGALSRPCLACVSAELLFEGSASHGGALRSQNALEALELSVQTVERLRGTRFHDVVIGHVVRAGGLMPSITPAEARLWLTVRHQEVERADAVYAEIRAIAAEAARLARTEVTEHLVAVSRGYLPNDALAAVLDRHLRAVGPPAWSRQDLDWMAALSRACDPRAPFELDQELAIHTEGCDPYGQDDGEASWRVPLGRVNWAIPRAVPFHHWGTTALSGSRAGLPGPLMAGQALARAAVELVTDPGPAAAARAELTRRVGSRVLSPPRSAPISVLAGAPDRFWDASWQAP